MAIFNSSGKMPVFNTWLINKVSGLIIFNYNQVRCLDKAYIQYIMTSRVFFNDLGKTKEVFNFQFCFIDSHSILWIVFDL